MIPLLDLPLTESLDELTWNADEIRDLIRTTPLRYDDAGLPIGYEAGQLFGLEVPEHDGVAP